MAPADAPDWLNVPRAGHAPPASSGDVAVAEPVRSPDAVAMPSPAPQPPGRAPEPTVAPGHPAVVRAGRVATIVGCLAALLLVYEFLLSGIPYGRSQAALLATFKQQVTTTLVGAPSSLPAEGAPVALLSIPSVAVNGVVVVEGSTPGDLKSGPGHLRDTPLPGEYGNAVIEGRRTTYGAPFGRLSNLRKGDAITLATGQGVVSYTVTRVAHVMPGQVDPITATPDSRLTLITSDPAYLATGQLAVTASLDGKPLAVARRPTVPTGVVDLGLAGDPLGLGLGLVWLELFATTLWLAYRLRRRLPLSIIYLFAMPTALTLALLAFSSLDSLLPGTM